MDDVQLERGEAPSNVNLVENGDLQYWGVDWTEGPASKYYKGVGLFEEGEYAHSIRIIGDAYTESCGYQEIPIYQTGKTYVLSGWAKSGCCTGQRGEGGRRGCGSPG